MKSSANLFAIVALIATMGACSPPAPERTEIIWDSWGVPHIYAPNTDDLFFAQGWAQMHLHANLILELYGSARGKAAEYWGKDHLENDILVHTLGFPALAEAWRAQQDPDFMRMASSLVDGMNAYAGAHPDAIDEDKKAVLPVTIDDVNLHYLYVVYTRFVGGGELGRVQRWSEVGSNTYAVAPSRSASGNAMLVQNPHLPWWREFLFTELHLNAPGVNSYGSTLVGFPGVAIAFNENLGWSHTNNTIDNADTYELTLDGDGYLLDGQRRAFDKSTVTLKIKTDDGLTDYDLNVLKAEHGPVVKMGEKKALALRMVGYDTPNAGLQWWKMATAGNFNEFEAALKMGQIPFWNVMYADKEGNIFYLFNGQVPVRKDGGWNEWNAIVKGDNSDKIWTTVHPYDDLPKVFNPEQGWLQNANDPPWTSTFPAALDPDDFPPYMAPRATSNTFRPQRSARMLHEDASITFEELEAYKLSTHLEMADRLLDDLFAAIDEHGGALAKEAGAVLEAWDRETDADSEGALLFYAWAMRVGPWNAGLYTTSYDLENPLATPDGLSDPKAAVEALETAAQEIKAKHGTLSVPWGEVYRITHYGKTLPGNGADGSVGSFRVAWSGGFGDDGTASIQGGDSWVGVIEFGERVRARVLLSYGNATQENSAHRGDQLDLFSRKEMRDARFYREDVDADIQRVDVLDRGSFVKQEQ